MSLLQLIGVNLGVTAALLLILWLISLKIRDVSIIDIFWGFGFVVIAWLTFFLSGGETSSRKVLLVLLTTIWGTRLSIHLARRKIGTPEDHRYQAMRAKVGQRFWLISLFLVFGLQGVIMNIVALPVVAGQLENAKIGVLAAIGFVLWMIGLAFEAVGDAQLARFKAKPENRGKVMDQGLWRYTRHPNYFGDFLIWWGLFFVAATGQNAWTAIGPAIMSFLLVRVSGVKLLEQSLKTSKEGYADYMSRTSAFFPWPPRP